MDRPRSPYVRWAETEEKILSWTSLGPAVELCPPPPPQVLRVFWKLHLRTATEISQTGIFTAADRAAWRNQISPGSAKLELQNLVQAIRWPIRKTNVQLPASDEQLAQFSCLQCDRCRWLHARIGIISCLGTHSGADRWRIGLFGYNGQI